MFVENTRWPNFGLMYTGDLFVHDQVALGSLHWPLIGPRCFLDKSFNVEHTTIFTMVSYFLR